MLFEEGLSQREIARQTRFHPRTIQRILAEDRGRLEALAALQADERRKEWSLLENDSIRQLRWWVRATEEAAFTEEGRLKPALTDLDLECFNAAAKVGSWLGRLATAGAGQVQLASGQPTARVASTFGGLDALAATDDELIAEAARLGMVAFLPARLREIAEAE